MELEDTSTHGTAALVTRALLVVARVRLSPASESVNSETSSENAWKGMWNKGHTLSQSQEGATARILNSILSRCVTLMGGIPQLLRSHSVVELALRPSLDFGAQQYRELKAAQLRGLVLRTRTIIEL